MKEAKAKYLSVIDAFNIQTEKDDAARKRKKAFIAARAKDRLLLKERGQYLDQIKKLTDEGLSEKDARQKLGPFRFSGAKPFFGQQVPSTTSI